MRQDRKRKRGAPDSWEDYVTGFEQPDAFMEHDRELKANPLPTMPNSWVSKSEAETGTYDPDDDFSAEAGDHFQVTWRGPDLPPTAGKPRYRAQVRRRRRGDEGPKSSRRH